METTESGNGQVVEDVTAEHVTVTQGGANKIKATTVDVTQGGAQNVRAETVSISQGGAFGIEAKAADLTMSGAAFIAGDTITMRQSGAGVVVADTINAEEGSMIGVLFAGSIEGNPNVRVDARTAAAFGAGFAVAAFALRRIFRS
jgi:hypothetical protein